MRVVFGWTLDGQCYPENGSGSHAGIGSPVCGPSGFLACLETQLGLRAPINLRVNRVAEYWRLLHEFCSEDDFYYASFNSDAWSTADSLLTLRDEAVAAGWDRQLIGFTSAEAPHSPLRKIASLAKIESSNAVPFGMADRLIAVNYLLRTISRKLIDDVLLVEPLQSYPSVWKQIFQRLESQGTRITEKPVQLLCDQSDLSRIQRALHQQIRDTGELVGDGSVTIIDADDELQAAEVLAAWLSARELAGTVLVRGQDCSVLDETFRRFGLPRIGGGSRSRFRTLLQVLPLAFEIIRRPLDPYRAVEFLSIPGGPIPEGIAKGLVGHLARSPGFDSLEWNELTGSYNVWFECRTRGEPPNDTIAIENAFAVCDRLERWACAAAAKQANSDLYQLTAGHARVLRQILKSSGLRAIEFVQLQKIIDSVLSYGASVNKAQAASWAVLDEPGQLWDAAQCVIWWGFAKTRWSQPRRLWSDHEMLALGEYGIDLESCLNRVRRDMMTSRMPIHNTAQRLVLVKPRAVAGERAVPHPLWDELQVLVGQESLSKCTVQSSNLFKLGRAQIAGSPIRCAESSRVSLPTPLRRWIIPAGVVPARKRESFSSIEKLLGCSLSWTFQYAGSMWAPKGLELPEKQLLLGKLAHTVVKKLIDRKREWSPKEAGRAASEILSELIPQMASQLLLPGFSPQLREANRAIPRSVEQLFKFINDAGAEVIGCECSMQRKFESLVDVGGDLDLLLRLPTGERAVIDFKWTGAPYRYRKKIVEGKALQLAIYSWLAAEDASATCAGSSSAPESSETTPEVLAAAGFFMFRHGELFFTADGVFPRFTVVRKMTRSIGETLTETFAAYEREMEKIKSGTITATGLDDDVELEAFMFEQLVEPPCSFCKFDTLCGKRELQ